jgi:hypothetical protein
VPQFADTEAFAIGCSAERHPMLDVGRGLVLRGGMVLRD